MSEIAYYLKDYLKGELVQTHSSFVILTDEFAYKIKKPVNFGFLDYSSLEKRRINIEKELKINKRLCPDVYLDMLPISKTQDGYEFSDKNIVEYALKMRRVKDELFLINRLDITKEDDIRDIATVVADFHLKTDKVYDIDLYQQTKFNTDENFAQTKDFIGITIEKEDYEFIKDAVNRFYDRYKDIFYERTKRSFVVDGHGDIRLEHVVMSDPPCIMDGIEFNDRFRKDDRINDMCFLSMELDLKGYQHLSKVYEDTYKYLTMDPHFDILINFYKCYRAYVRGKVTSFLLNDPHIEDKDSVVKSSKTLFNLSKEYATKF